MKIQSLGIIFIVIVFPLILVLSYYLSLQIETITLQNDYNSKLIDATNDALTAFELNTANEELSNVSDSLRSIVDASTNTFMNTLATSLGMSNASKDVIEAYVPAILYTLYDGYYIHAPTQKPEIKEKTYTNANGIVTSEGAAIVGEEAGFDDGGPRPGEVNPGPKLLYQGDGSTDENPPGDANDYGSLLYEQNDPINPYSTTIGPNTVTNTDYVLKSYMPYSATYVLDDDNTVTINYTLDNFISISGLVNGIYYTKSGYYISNNINIITIDGTSYNIDEYGQDKWKEICLDTNKKIVIETLDGITIETLDSSLTATKQEKEANRKAITYYLTNTVFSNWVNTNLTFVNGSNMSHIIDYDNLNNQYSTDNIRQMFHDFRTDGTQIFGTGEDPEDASSNFNTHKYNVIKNSIQYNLNLAISSYSEMFSGLTFEMPMLTDLEWEQITEKVSVVSFLQGLNCGLKTYSGYTVITSTNNELTVIPEEIYYVKASEFDNEDSYYHRLDCEHIAGETNFVSFKSKEVKYDEIYKGDAAVPQYEYDHKNLACYDCIVQNNYHNHDRNGDGTKDKKINLRAFLGLEHHIDEDGDFIGTATPPALLKAYYIAVGKERQNLYKTTAYSKNEGIRISDTNNIVFDDKIAKAEVTIRIDTPVTYPARVVDEIEVGGSTVPNKLISVSTRSTQTVIIENTGSIGGAVSCDGGAGIVVESIKYIYK